MLYAGLEHREGVASEGTSRGENLEHLSLVLRMRLQFSTERDLPGRGGSPGPGVIRRSGEDCSLQGCRGRGLI